MGTIVFTCQLQVLDSSICHLKEQSATASTQELDVNILQSMTLTIKYTAKVDTIVFIVNGIVTEGLHTNTCHIDIIHKLSLDRVVYFKENSTISNKLLRIADEVVAILVLKRNDI